MNSWLLPSWKRSAWLYSLAARRGKWGTSRDERRSVRYGVSDERWVADGRWVEVGQGGGGGLTSLQGETSVHCLWNKPSHEREWKGWETEQETESNVEWGRRESERGGSHIAHLQAVNNLEEHWETRRRWTQNTGSVWPRAAATSVHITERRALSRSSSRFPLFSLFCSSSASLCVREETAVRYSCFTSRSMKLNRMADNSVPRESLFLPSCSGHIRRASRKRNECAYGFYCLGREKQIHVCLDPLTHTRLVIPSHHMRRNIYTASQDKRVNFKEFKLHSSHFVPPSWLFMSSFLKLHYYWNKLLFNYSLILIKRKTDVPLNTVWELSAFFS